MAINPNDNPNDNNEEIKNEVDISAREDFYRNKEGRNVDRGCCTRFGKIMCHLFLLPITFIITLPKRCKIFDKINDRSPVRGESISSSIFYEKRIFKRRLSEIKKRIDENKNDPAEFERWDDYVFYDRNFRNGELARSERMLVFTYKMPSNLYRYLKHSSDISVTGIVITIADIFYFLPIYNCSSENANPCNSAQQLGFYLAIGNFLYLLLGWCRFLKNENAKEMLLSSIEQISEPFRRCFSRKTPNLQMIQELNEGRLKQELQVLSRQLPVQKLEQLNKTIKQIASKKIVLQTFSQRRVLQETFQKIPLASNFSTDCVDLILEYSRYHGEPIKSKRKKENSEKKRQAEILISITDGNSRQDTFAFHRTLRFSQNERSEMSVRDANAVVRWHKPDEESRSPNQVRLGL